MCGNDSGVRYIFIFFLFVKICRWKYGDGTDRGFFQIMFHTLKIAEIWPNIFFIRNQLWPTLSPNLASWPDVDWWPRESVDWLVLTEKHTVWPRWPMTCVTWVTCVTCIHHFIHKISVIPDIYIYIQKDGHSGLFFSHVTRAIYKVFTRWPCLFIFV